MCFRGLGDWWLARRIPMRLEAVTTFIMEQDPRRHNNRHATFGATTLRLSVLMSLVKKKINGWFHLSFQLIRQE